MANAQNKKSAKSFQDDLDAIFDGLDLENYSDNLKDDSDELDRLLTEKIAGQSVTKKELTDADVDRLLKVSDMQRFGSKVVALDKKRDIDALLDEMLGDESRLNGNRDFEFNSFDADNKDANFLKAEIQSTAEDKTTEALKKVVFDQFDDFESFDEFGDIDAVDRSKNSDLPSVAKQGESVKPESMVDLEDTFGIKFKPSTKDVDVEFEALGDESAMIATSPVSSMGSHAKLDTTDIEEKFENLSTDKVVPEEEKPMTVFATEAKVATQPAKTLDYELLDDDFAEMPDSHAEVEHKNIEAAKAFAVEADDEDFEFFGPSSVDAFISKPWDQDEVSSDESPGIGVGNEIDDFGHDDIDMVTSSMATTLSEMIVGTQASDEVGSVFNRQISELWAAHHQVTQRVDELVQGGNYAEQPNKMEELDRQSKERKERKQLQELVEGKSKATSRLAYAAASVSVLSLLIGGGLLAFGWVSLSDVKALKAHTAILDKDVAGLKAGGASASAVQGHTGDNASVLQLAEQVKKIQGLLTGDKAAVVHGLNASADLSAAHALKDIQYDGDKSIRIIASVDKNVPPAAGHAKPSGERTAPLWVANLLSVRQSEYAQQKAADFAKQGIPVAVVPVNVNGQTLYILRSSGFSTQDQALQYATKAKKALNLSSILVSQDE